MVKRGLKPVLLYLPFHVAVVAVTWRDIARRPADQIRGRKSTWKLVSAANTAGALAYWLAGRR